MYEPEDVEIGDEPVTAKVADNLGVRVSIRLTREEAERLMALAARRGQKFTDFARDLLLNAAEAEATRAR